MCNGLYLNHPRNLTKYTWLDTLPRYPNGGGARAHEDSPLGSDIQLLTEKSNDQHLASVKSLHSIYQVFSFSK